MAQVTHTRDDSRTTAAEAKPRFSAGRRWPLTLSVAVCGITISMIVYWLLLVRERQLQAMRFQFDGRERAEAIQRELNSRLGAVRLVSAFFSGSELVTRDEFRTFCDPLVEKYPDLRALAWLPRVPRQHRSAYEEAVRAEGLPDYQIKEDDAEGNFFAAGDRDEYLPVCLIEPAQENQWLVGYDFGSNPGKVAAMRKAMNSGRPCAALCTAPNRDGSGGAILYLIEPVTNEDASPTTARADGSQPDGVVVGLFAVGALARDAMDIFFPLGIDVYIYDSSAGNEKRLIAVRLSSRHGRDANLEPLPAEVQPPEASVHFELPTAVADHQWTIDCVPMNVYFTRQRTWGPLATLLTGLAITGFAVGYLNLLTGRAARVEELVSQQTRELRRSEAALRNEQRVLRNVLELQERERKLAAYEIHDGVSQQLAGAIYKFDAVNQLHQSDPPAAHATFGEAIRLLREAMVETRRLIGGLRPPVLDDLGVVAAIDYLITQQHRSGGIEIEFIHGPDLNRWPPPLESAVFRIIQECLTNARRYSQSPRVRVELAQSDGCVRIDVRDWGIGFDPRRVEQGHFGLQGIRERARLLGGAVRVEAAPQQGTHVAVEIPMPVTDDADSAEQPG